MRIAGAEQRIDREHAALDPQAGRTVVEVVEIGVRAGERALLGGGRGAEAEAVVCPLRSLCVMPSSAISARSCCTAKPAWQVRSSADMK